jgi:hypothetical protein
LVPPPIPDSGESVSFVGLALQAGAGLAALAPVFWFEL